MPLQPALRAVRRQGFFFSFPPTFLLPCLKSYMKPNLFFCIVGIIAGRKSYVDAFSLFHNDKPKQARVLRFKNYAL